MDEETGILTDHGSENESSEESEDEDEVKPRGRGRPRGKKNGSKSLKRKSSQEEKPKKKSKRGMHLVSRKQETPELFDDDGTRLELRDDEVMGPLDPKGEQKVDLDGNLKGGRTYRIRTFTCSGRGDRLYMLSTEPARCMGFRDSYLFFQKHKHLYKVIISNDEKHDLIARDILPHSYKGRTIGLVTARSVFREFGARIISGGRNIVDDYFEDKARSSGKVEGALADPTDDRAQRTYLGGGGLNQGTPIAEFERKPNSVITEESWIYENASSTRQFDNEMLQVRNSLWTARGARDIYTGINFVPVITQPEHVKCERVSDGQGKLVFDTVMDQPTDCVRTGLADVPESIFGDCVSGEVKAAILKQQKLEKECF